MVTKSWQYESCAITAARYTDTLNFTFTCTFTFTSYKIRPGLGGCGLGGLGQGSRGTTVYRAHVRSQPCAESLCYTVPPIWIGAFLWCMVMRMRDEEEEEEKVEDVGRRREEFLFRVSGLHMVLVGFSKGAISFGPDHSCLASLKVFHLKGDSYREGVCT